MAITRSYGIDVSYYQGSIDWAAVKNAGVEWVILRGGFGNSSVDTQFINNITGAAAAGIENIGVYWFSYVSDDATAKKEVNFCLQTIEPYRQYINLPVFFDWEEASYSYVKNTYGVELSNLQIQQFATTWCNAITAAGYATGIYSNKHNAENWFKQVNGQYLWQALNCDFWYARYGANNETSLFIIPAFEQTALSEHPEAKIYQYADVGRVTGINSQRVDLNIMYIDTPEPPEPPTPTPGEEIERPHTDNIDYLEIRDTSLNVVNILDTAKSIIWHSKYYGVGDFEVYVVATAENINLLHPGNYVTRPNDIEVGIIESVQITDNEQDGKMIIASGRFAKSILDRRHIYKLSGKTNAATILTGNVEAAARQLITDNAINCTFDNKRNIPILKLGAAAGITSKIVDENGNAAQKQVSFENLLEYTDELLKEYKIGSVITLDEINNKLKYYCYSGVDRSTSNADANEPVIFSREFDNLTASEYLYNSAEEKTAALVGGEGEGIERFYTMFETAAAGLSRKETFVDASSISLTYKDENEQEQTYPDTEYAEMLKTEARQKMAEMIAFENFSGSIDITTGMYIYNRDFSIGDIVTIQDNDINKYLNARITEVTEVQDENGYQITIEYESEV